MSIATAFFLYVGLVWIFVIYLLISTPKKPKEKNKHMNLNDIYKAAHEKTGGEKDVDIAQHNESCSALMDVLAEQSPSDVLKALEDRNPGK